MRRLFYICCLVGILVLTTLSIINQANHEHELDQEQKPKISPYVLTPTSAPKRNSSIFIPYWTDWKTGTAGLSAYDGYIYFGVVPGKSGINTTDAGYTNISNFNAVVTPGKPKWLTIRTTNSSESTDILRNQQSWSAL